MRIISALAKHEVAHVVKSWHDEEYSTVHTEIDMKFNETRVYKEMKDAIKAA